jgi:hypothetical protein
MLGGTIDPVFDAMRGAQPTRRSEPAEGPSHERRDHVRASALATVNRAQLGLALETGGLTDARVLSTA